jgi:hypothetical protein
LNWDKVAINLNWDSVAIELNRTLVQDGTVETYDSLN